MSQCDGKHLTEVNWYNRNLPKHDPMGTLGTAIISEPAKGLTVTQKELMRLQLRWENLLTTISGFNKKAKPP